MPGHRRSRSFARTALRAGQAALLALAGLTCRDTNPTGPGLRLPAARFGVVPSFQQTPAEGPSVQLTRVRAVLYTNTTPAESVVVLANFQGDSAIVQFDVGVTGASQVMHAHL